MIWILSTEFAVNSMWISTLLQFFVTLGYEGRAVERISNKNRTIFTIALPVVSVAGTFGTINASKVGKKKKKYSVNGEPEIKTQ